MEIVECCDHLFVCHYWIGVCLKEVPSQNWFRMGGRLNKVFNLAVAPAMDAALGEEEFGLGWAGKVEGDFLGRFSS